MIAAAKSGESINVDEGSSDVSIDAGSESETTPVRLPHIRRYFHEF